MKIKDALTEFENTQKEQEEALKNVENTEPVEQAGEAKSEGEFVEAPKAEDQAEPETNQEEQLEADAEQADAQAEPEDKDEEADKEDSDKDEAEDKEDAEDDKEDDEKAEKSVDEEDAEKSAKVSGKKDQKDKEKETDGDVKDSLKDKEDTDEDGKEEDQGKPRKPKKGDKSKTEQAKKSDEDFEDLEGLVGLVLKSYQQSVESQNNMMATITELKAELATLNSRLESKVDEEETSKSILKEEVIQEQIEDKAVGYVAKSTTAEAETVADTDLNEAPEGEHAEQGEQSEAKETFNYSTDKDKFMEKFQHDLSKEALPRRDVDLYRQAFIDASENVATENALNLLHGYING